MLTDLLISKKILCTKKESLFITSIIVNAVFCT